MSNENRNDFDGHDVNLYVFARAFTQLLSDNNPEFVPLSYNNIQSTRSSSYSFPGVQNLINRFENNTTASDPHINYRTEEDEESFTPENFQEPHTVVNNLINYFENIESSNRGPCTNPRRNIASETGMTRHDRIAAFGSGSDLWFESRTFNRIFDETHGHFGEISDPGNTSDIEVLPLDEAIPATPDFSLDGEIPDLVSGDNFREPHASTQTKNGPLFHFEKKESIVFYPETNNLLNILEYIKIYRGCYFNFENQYRDNFAYGKGATRQVYTHLCNELTDTIMINTHPYFFDINDNCEFWQLDENIESFVVFVAMVIKSGCLLPFHFPPALLEIICHKKLNYEELGFFMEKINPIIFESAQKINSMDFKFLDIGFDNHEEFYHAHIIGHTDDKKLNIYKAISKHFELFDSFNDYKISEIDEKFSGLYTITSDHVIPLISMNNQKYNTQWKKFVRSLSEQELKQMLITFGNTLALNHSYSVNINYNMNTDINIMTCLRTVNINEKLFQNEEHLNNLRQYFSGYDQISDGHRVIEAGTQPHILDSDHGHGPRVIEVD